MRNKKNENHKIKKWEKISMIAFAVSLLTIGILILFILLMYDMNYNYLNTEMSVSSILYKNLYYPFFYSIGIILIGISIGTLIVDLFGYLNYFRKRIAEVFTEKDIVDILDNDYKLKLRHNLLNSIYKPDTTDSQEVLYFFDTKISNILETYYYKDYDLLVECSIEDKKYIKKEITKTITLKEINSNNKKSYDDIFIELTCQTLSDDNIKPFELCYVKVDNKEVEYENKSSDNPENKLYNLKFVGKFKEPVNIKKETKLNFKYITRTPINDRKYSITIDKLCKNMNCKFCFNGKEMKVTSNSFKFSTDDNSKPVINNSTTISIFNSNGWILPGEGVVFTLLIDLTKNIELENKTSTPKANNKKHK